jgi:hypothetical protein
MRVQGMLLVAGFFLVGANAALAQDGHYGPFSQPSQPATSAASQNNFGPQISPQGGAAGGICYGPNCGSSDNSSRSNFGPQVSPHGGAGGGTCFGPRC